MGRRLRPGTTGKEERRERSQASSGPDGADLGTWVRDGLGAEPLWWRELATWPGERQALWEERAAIMEVDGELARNEAEQYAFLAVKGA